MYAKSDVVVTPKPMHTDDGLVQWCYSKPVGFYEQLAEKIGEKEVALGGLIAQMKTLRTRKGDPMAILRLEDQEGAAEVVVFPDAYKEYYGVLSNDTPVLVKGKAQHGDDLSKILASEIVPLDEVHQREASSMVLRIELDSFLVDTLPHLLEVLESNRGNCSVRFELYRKKEFELSMAPHPYLRIQPNPDLVSDLEAMCGHGSVILSNGGQTETRGQSAHGSLGADPTKPAE